MSRRLVFAYPGDLQTRTGGYGYDRRVIKALGDLGWLVESVSLGDAFPGSDPAAIEAAGARLSQLADGDLVLVDGLAFAVMEDWAAREAARLKIIALVHHPLALETGLDDSRRTELAGREKAALAQARAVIVTSHHTAAGLVANYAVPAGKIAVAVPGVDRPPGVSKQHENETPIILSIGTLTRRKGHDVLLAALARLKDLSWTCRIVGSTKLDPDVAAEIERQITDMQLEDRVALVGQVEDTRPELEQADIFALASRYEGYGMVFAEALVYGLPVVGCAAGAVPDVVPPDAGFLVPVDDPDTLAAALRRLLLERDTRAAMAHAALQAGQQLPSWRQAAEIISDALEASA